MLDKNYNRSHYEIFFLNFLQKIGFDISCVNCQGLFSSINKEKCIFFLSSAEFSHRVIKVNVICHLEIILDHLYHSVGIFSRQQIDIFHIFSQKIGFNFHANCLFWRQFANRDNLHETSKPVFCEK